ncbi:MAG: hypothetical protein NVS3B1_17590 [Marmoricola sp.]
MTKTMVCAACFTPMGRDDCPCCGGTVAVPDPACGTTGCEMHDGECRDGWKWF